MDANPDRKQWAEQLTDAFFPKAIDVLNRNRWTVSTTIIREYALTTVNDLLHRAVPLWLSLLKGEKYDMSVLTPGRHHRTQHIEKHWDEPDSDTEETSCKKKNTEDWAEFSMRQRGIIRMFPAYASCRCLSFIEEYK